MLINVATRVTASFGFPMADLHSLRRACSLMRDRVCGAALVRCSLNLRVVLRQSDDTEISEGLIANTYSTDNLEALFIMRMSILPIAWRGY